MNCRRSYFIQDEKEVNIARQGETKIEGKSTVSADQHGPIAMLERTYPTDGTYDA
jgi:hypothetical protein